MINEKIMLHEFTAAVKWATLTTCYNGKLKIVNMSKTLRYLISGECLIGISYKWTHSR